MWSKYTDSQLISKLASINRQTVKSYNAVENANDIEAELGKRGYIVGVKPAQYVGQVTDAKTGEEFALYTGVQL